VERRLEAIAGEALRRDVPLREHTSFAVGGPARLFVESGASSVVAGCLAAAVDGGERILFLGGGTNLLVSDAGFDGVVVKPAFDGLELHPEEGQVVAGASIPAARLVDELVDRGLGGLEFAAGLPGTVGGAVAGNAGCFGSTFGDRLLWAEVITGAGEVARVERDALGFCYRRSEIAARGWLVSRVCFVVEEADRGDLLEIADGHKATRRERHPAPTRKTAGSYFKNLPPLEPGGRRRAAGQLLDAVGAKEMRVGDATVFEKHANIIVNAGSATAAQILQLAGEMAARVEDRFGVILEPEVRFVG